MEDLGYLTAKIRLQTDRAYAVMLAQRNTDPAQWRRFVRGVAVNDAEAKNIDGATYNAQGLTVSLPVPLLLSHDWNQPVGVLTGIDVQGRQINFKAEICNAEHMDVAFNTWIALIEQRLTCVSMRPRNVGHAPVKGHVTTWTIDEVSLCDSGKDPGARVTRCFERAPVIYLDGRSTEVVHWSRT